MADLPTVTSGPPADFRPGDEPVIDDPCIMLVDDEPVVSEVLRLYLEDEGYRDFEILTDSRLAVSRAVERQPDLLLLDLMMPDVDGFQILEALRGDPSTRHLHVIVLTSATEPESKLRALELGATDFIAKPVDPSELILRVRNTLAMKAYQDRLAYFDRTTGLPNRRRFLERLTRGLAQARQQGSQCAVLQIGVDRFKRVNDTLGYGAGDGVLAAFGERLREVLTEAVDAGRGPDHVASCLARTGGDEFSALLHVSSVDAAMALAEEIRSCASKSLTAQGEPLYLSASVGIAVSPEHGVEVDDLLAHVGHALSFVKRRGGDGVAVFSEQIDAWSSDRMLLERDLREALATDALHLEYQPKVDVHSGSVVGAEALLRWQHPTRGRVGPSEFIPIAEETGLIVSIGTWVLNQVCDQAAEWQRAGRGDLSVAVNVSPRQFDELDLFEVVRGAIARTGIRPEILTLEVTEGLLLNDVEQAVRTLESLATLGVRLSVDDFGTGYSSLAYLKSLRVQELKIDKSFLDEIPDNASDAAIVSAVIAMARILDLKVVAEGVEKPAQLAFLARGGCDTYQGYLFSRSVSAEKFLSLATAGLPANVSLRTDSPARAIR